MFQYVPWNFNKAASRQLHTGTKEVLYELHMPFNIFCESTLIYVALFHLLVAWTIN